MKTADIQERLKGLFEAPQRHGEPMVVVWDDPDGEFEALVDELELPGVEVLRDADGTRFAAKRRLNELGSGDKALIYRKRAARDTRGDWFADAVRYGRHFQADLVSSQLEDLSAADTADMRAALKHYRAFLSKKTNMRRLKQARTSYETVNQLHTAVMAAALGKGVAADFASVLVAYLTRAYDEGVEAPLGDVESAGALEAFRTMCSQTIGYIGDVAAVDAMARHLFVTALAYTVDAAKLTGLDRLISAAHAQICHELVLTWSSTPGAEAALAETVYEVEASCDVVHRLEALSVAELLPCDALPCVSVIIARKLLEAVAEGADVSADIRMVYERRRVMPWFEDVSSYYEALIAAASMQELFREHADGFHAESAQVLWDAYARDLYRVDSAYRAFSSAFERALLVADIELDDALKAAAQRIENLYKNWFLGELNVRWFDLCEQDFGRMGYAADIPRLRDFYLTHVAPVAKDARVFVIVSDALRYEVAAELAERLERETKGQATLKAMQAPFPSITATGMASLLPQTSIELSCDDGGVRVLANGMPTRSIADRAAVLRAQEPTAVAVRQEEFVSMRRDERRELVKDAQVVYVYHNAVDATGDDAKTEHDVFEACETAMREIVALVRIITGELRCSNVVITADHGFLYTREPLDELDHVAAEEMDATLLKETRRYALAPAGSRARHLVEVAMGANSSDELVGFTPRGCARIRRQGAGENYVHGGLSLQELCVPVVRFKNMRAGSSAYVEAEPVAIELLDPTSPITNTLFRLRFFQTEPVGGKKLEGAYNIVVEDAAGDAVSDEVLLAADRTSTEAADRELTAQFALKAGFSPSSSQTYYIVARHAQTGVVAWRREVRIEVAFAPAVDFGW